MTFNVVTRTGKSSTQAAILLHHLKLKKQFFLFILFFYLFLSLYLSS